MKHLITAIIWIACAVTMHAQSIPAEWMRYTTEDYLYDVQTEINVDNLPETQFKKKLQEAAFASLAKKVSMHINDQAQITKTSVNGRTKRTYDASTKFSTDVNITLADSKFKYSASEQKGEFILYINKIAACMFYKNDMRQKMNSVESAIETAQGYIDNGFYEHAKKELEKVQTMFYNIDETLFWLNYYGANPDDIFELQNDINTLEQTVKKMLMDLKHGITICIICESDVFGKPYPELERAIKGKLADNIDCNFTIDVSEADWVININASAREYNVVTIGEREQYFCFADANVTIYKTSTAQTIYEDVVSAKGGHTISFNDAGRTAYRNLVKDLNDILTTNIKE